MSEEAASTAFDPLVPQVAAATGRVYLVVREPASTRVVEVPKERELVIGRAPDVDIVLTEPRVSRRHAIVTRVGGELRVRDGGSRNSTSLNGRLLGDAELPIRAGDVLQVGPVEIAIAVSPEWAEAPAGAASLAGGGRLEHELARLAREGGRAVLLRIAVGGAFDASMSAALDAMAVVEERTAGEYAALLDGAAESKAGEIVARVQSAAPSARVSLVRFPEDGTTAAELWAAARRRADVRGAVAASPGTIVADPAMVDLYARVRRVATAPTSVLILGETGAGKEIVAEHLHRWSARGAGPFVRLNCASLPDQLLESELFGHEKGAFTGADTKKVGYFEVANGGTLFFDEVGELPLAMQAKLLRVLETRTITPLGGTKPRQVDVRIVAATHRDLEAEASRGTFRLDLYYRLNGFTLQLPPLRERPTELVLLSELFAQRFASAMNAPPPVFSEASRVLMRSYPWPGNVRELKNAVEYGILSADAGVLEPIHFPPAVQRGTPPAQLGSSSSLSSSKASGGEVDGDENMRARVADMERRSIEEALRAEDGNATRTAIRLGLSRGALLRKLEKYGIKK